MGNDTMSRDENKPTPEKKIESLPELPDRKNKVKRPILRWPDVLVLLMCLFVVVGLMLPTRIPAPPPVVFYLSNDSPQDQTLRAVIEGLGKLPAEQRVTISDSTQVNVRILMCEHALPGTPKKEDQWVSVHQLEPVKLIRETVRLLCIYDFGRNNVIIRRFVPKYDLWIPVAYYKLEDGTNRVYYTHVFSGPVIATFSEQFEKEFGRKWDGTRKEDWHYLKEIRIREAIKTRTDEELKADIETVTAEAQKFPTHQESERLQQEWLQEAAEPVN